MNTRGYFVILCFGVIFSAPLTVAINGHELHKLMTTIDSWNDKLQEIEQNLQKIYEKVDSKFETRINALENSLQNTIKEIELALKKRQIKLQDLLIRLEKDYEERLEKVSFKHKTSIQAMENSLKKIQMETINATKESHNDLQYRLAKLEKEVVERIGKVDIENSLKKSLEATETKARDGLEDLKNQLNFNMSHIRQHQIAQIKSYQETSQTELKKIDENKKSLDTLSDWIRNISSLSEKNNKILEAHFSYPVRSCRHVMTSGRYVMYVGPNSQSIDVLCEQTKFEGGWTVIQQRFNGSVDFYRNWTEYRNGFGSLDGEFWIGLEHMHQMTKNRPHELLVEVKDFHGNYGYAKYGEFEIGTESEKYVLKKLGTYSGTAGDALQRLLNQKFSTYDRDNDYWSTGMCAKNRHGAWWYDNCTDSNLNGRYKNTANDLSAMEWYKLKNDSRGMSFSRMMIRNSIN